MSRNAATKEGVDRARDDARTAREVHLDRVRHVVGHQHGREVMFHYLERCGFFSSSFSVSHAEASFREGERHIGRMIAEDIGLAAPELLAKMLIAHMQGAKE